VDEEREQRRIEEAERKRHLFSRNEGVGELRQLTETELRERDDAVALQLEGSGPPHLLYGRRMDAYRAELQRREYVRQGTTSLNRLTWWIVALTVLIAIATIIGVAPTAWTLLSGA
jgi:hypothetical protein